MQSRAGTTRWELKDLSHVAANTYVVAVELQDRNTMANVEVALGAKPGLSACCVDTGRGLWQADVFGLFCQS